MSVEVMPSASRTLPDFMIEIAYFTPQFTLSKNV